MLRLKPGQDIKQHLIAYAQKNKIQSGVIVSAVGSVSQLRVRIADGLTVKEKTQAMEVVHFSGTLTQFHLHAHILGINTQMQTFGGHLKEGSIVHTTMEITLIDVSDEFHNTRTFDESTGYDELVVKRVNEI